MAELSFNPVALHGFSILFTNRKANPNSLAAVTFTIQDKSGTRADRTPTVHPVEIVPAAQAVADRQHLHGQGFAAMGAAAGQDFPTALGTHPGQESVDRLVHPAFRLIGTFDHFLSSF